MSLGVKFKWDMSRRISVVIQNPASIPREQFPDEDGGAAYTNPIPNGTVIPFPGDPLIGNDDYANIDPENDDPYKSCDITDPHFLKHDAGQLSSYDKPVILLPHPAGFEGETCSQKFLAQEFVRLEIGGAWYVVSDPLKWKLVGKEKFTGGHWLDDGSDLLLEN